MSNNEEFNSDAEFLDGSFNGDDDTPRAPLFRLAEKDRPVRFFIHPTVTVDQREGLTTSIQGHGGVVIDQEYTADVVLVDHEYIRELERRHAHSKRIYVEDLSFVRRCEVRGEYHHEPPRRMPMTGRPPGKARQEFTREDDENLALYLARRIPYKVQGGRLGNKIYLELCDESQAHRYPWASRHTWQSWRNRYKQDIARFDKTIEVCVELSPPHPTGKGEYVRTKTNDIGANGGARRQNAVVLNEYKEEDELQSHVDELSERSDAEASNEGIQEQNQ